MRSTLAPVYTWVQSIFKEQLIINKDSFTLEQADILEWYMKNVWLMKLMANSFFNEWWEAKYDDTTYMFTVEQWTLKAIDDILKKYK